MINESGQTDKLLTWLAFSAPAFSSKKTNSILPLFHFDYYKDCNDCSDYNDYNNYNDYRDRDRGIESDFVN